MEDKKEYIAIWESYESFFEQYSDAEVGRLVQAMMKYKWSGVVPQFTGSERFIWPAIKRDMDAAAERVVNRAKTNSQNGAKGGRPKKADASSESPETPNLFEETKKANGFQRKQKSHRKGKEMEMEMEKGKGKENGEEDFCEEPETDSPPVIELPLNDNTAYPISPEQFGRWAELYPAVDVMQELRKMLGWLEANPVKRKTRRGILRFITGWLAKEQDKGSRKEAGNRPSTRTQLSAMDDLRALHNLFDEE